MALTRTRPSPLLAAPPRRQLLAVIALVVAVHALLLVGLPEWPLKARASSPSAAFVTRLVAPLAPEAAPEPAIVPPVPVAPPKPQAQRPKRAPRPTPPPAAPQPEVKSDTDAPVSLLAQPSLASFGGSRGPMPIQPPLPADETAAALQLAAGAGDAPVRVAPAARLNYQTRGQIGGRAFALSTTLDWRHDGQSYESRWAVYTPLFGGKSRSATGLLSPQGLVPVQAALLTPEAQNMRFDYAARQVRLGDADADPIDAPLRAGAQDPLSVLLQLGALLAGDAKRYPVGTRIELPAVRPRGTGTWRFTVEAEEPVTALQGRELPTLRLVHQPEDENDARIEVWLGRDVNYLPVRLRITESNGDTVEHTMETAALQVVPPLVAPAQ